ncbi:hypothetical protein SBRY_40663 [Actinacidiphila bryophytorum]|uniref:Uncharacterized protein n=1 Tax=Actinacidiphila bryophytorum TaxID=1436133 RepID=A0A9W4H3E1_9ACTN|nr:hypothetical protein SBRY_40663 [Actinacidiphila bryophytorum]
MGNSAPGRTGAPTAGGRGRSRPLPATAADCLRQLRLAGVGSLRNSICIWTSRHRERILRPRPGGTRAAMEPAHGTSMSRSRDMQRKLMGIGATVVAAVGARVFATSASASVAPPVDRLAARHPRGRNAGAGVRLGAG